MFYEANLKSIRFSAQSKFRVLDMGVLKPVDPDAKRRPGAGAVKTAEVDNDILIYGDTPSLREHKSRMLSQAVIVDAVRMYFEKEKQFPQQRRLDRHAWMQKAFPTFVSENPSDEGNIRAFKQCLSISENYGDKTFIVRAHSTNKYKVNWILTSFIDSYKKNEEQRVKKSSKDVLSDNESRYEAKKKRYQEIDDKRDLHKEKLRKEYGDGFSWQDGTETKQREKEEIISRISQLGKESLQLKSEIQEFQVFEPDRWLIEDGEGHKIVELQNELYSKREQLRQELESLRVDFTDKHPKVVRKLAELNSLNDAFPRLAKEIVENKLRTLNRQLSNKEDLEVRFKEDLLRVNQEIQVISEQERYFNGLDEEQEEIKGDMARLEQHIDRLEDELTRSDDPVELLIFPPAQGQLDSLSPNMKYYILLFGVVIGFGFAYLLDYMDDTIRTPHDVEKFVGMRVIGTVPLLSRGEEKLLHRIALKSPISEMMNTLSMIIQSWMLKMKGQSLLIVSSKPSEGKSTFITNLSVAMCRGGEKVVLIDSDMRKPSLHRFFGVDNSVGLSNYLEGSFSNDVDESDEARIAKIVHHTDVEGLFLIPSGPIPSNPVGLLKGENIDRLLSHLKTYIGVILIDTPPLAMIDAGVLATKVNAVVTVMDAGKVSKKEALAGKHLIENVGGNGIGVILNKVTLEGEEYYYYFEGYSYYYGNSRSRKKKPV
jgi:capsular exopolysaccharide synthesis family protein